MQRKIDAKKERKKEREKNIFISHFLSLILYPPSLPPPPHPGLLMLGQSDSELAQTIIPDLLNYTHDTSHEKIVR